MRRWLQHCALIVLAALVVTAWWELRVEAPMRAPRVTAETIDDFAYYYPMFRYGFDEVRHGHFPFWNPYQQCGTPFFATAQHLLLYPLNTLYLLLPVPAAMKGTAILHLTLAILFTFFLGRTHGMGAGGALTAGVLFAFSPAVACLICIPHHLYGAVWIPLHLALTRRLLTRPSKARYAVLLGLALAVQYLGAYPMLCLFSVYAVAAYVLWYVATAWHELTWRALGQNAVALAAAALLAICVALPQLLPALELAKLSPRALGGLTIDMVDPYAPGWRAIFWYAATAVLPTVNAPLGVFLHAGVIGFALAAAALVLRRPSRHVAFFALLALLSGLLALGRHTPLFAAYFMLPTANWFRMPSRFFILTSLGVAMVAGFGVDLLLRDAIPRTRLLVASCITALLALVGFGLLLGDGTVLSQLGALVGGRVEARWAALDAYLLGLTMWLAAYMRWHRARTALVGVLATGAFASLFFSFLNLAALPETDPDLHVMPRDVVEFLRDHQHYDRTYIRPWGTMMPAGLLPARDRTQAPRPGPIPVKAGMMHHIYVMGDRENVYPARISAYALRMLDREKFEPVRKLLEAAHLGSDQIIPQGDLSIWADSPNLQLLDLLGVRFIVEGPGTDFQQRTAPARFPLVYEGNGVRIYRNAAVGPRAYLVGKIEVVTDAARALDRLSSPDFDPWRTAVLEEEPERHPEQLASAPDVRIVDYAPHQVIVDATTTSAAFLVLTDQYYPGWVAEVDGAPAHIYRADYLFRGVFLDPGAHRIVFRFVPTTFYLGCLIGAGGMLSELAIFLLVRRHARRSHDRPMSGVADRL